MVGSGRLSIGKPSRQLDGAGRDASYAAQAPGKELHDGQHLVAVAGHAVAARAGPLAHLDGLKGVADALQLGGRDARVARGLAHEHGGAGHCVDGEERRARGHAAAHGDDAPEFRVTAARGRGAAVGEFDSDVEGGHGALGVPKQDDASWSVAAFLWVQQHAAQHVVEHEADRGAEAWSVRIEGARARVDGDVVAPVEATQVKGQRFGAAEGDAGRLWKIELTGKVGEGLLRVSKAVEEQQQIGCGMVCGSCGG